MNKTSNYPRFGRCLEIVYRGIEDLTLDPKFEQGKLLELLREQTIIPGGDFGQPVIGNHEGARLNRGQVIEAQRRHLRQAKLFAGQQSTVSGYNIAEAINQDRDIEAKTLDTAGELQDLLLAVAPRIGVILISKTSASKWLRSICGSPRWTSRPTARMIPPMRCPMFQRARH
jgi:hypothetical protein